MGVPDSVTPDLVIDHAELYPTPTKEKPDISIKETVSPKNPNTPDTAIISNEASTHLSISKITDEEQFTNDFNKSSTPQSGTLHKNAHKKQSSVDMLSNTRPASFHSAKSVFSGFFGQVSKHSSYGITVSHEYTNTIKDYELINDIGGVDDISYLYLAKHIPTGSYVSLKYTDLALSPDFEFVEELIRTVMNTCMCRHPNILPYLTSFIENERLWNVTYPVRAGSCRLIMKTGFEDGFSEVCVATILKEVLRAIQYLHEKRMIHNDIRADNILMDVHGEIKLTGVRQLINLSQNGGYISSVFSLVGDNLEWSAPEIMSQNTNFTEKVDIYSLGITAIELAFNRTPFDDWQPMKILLNKLKYDMPNIKTDKIFSREFYSFIKICTQKNPDVRPSASVLLEHPFIKLSKSQKYLETHVVSKVISSYREDQEATLISCNKNDS